MKWIRSIFREVLGLFVDDTAFALAILIWIGFTFWIMSRVNLPHSIVAILFFAGLALILIESTARYARRKR